MNSFFRFLADFISDVLERRSLIRRFNDSAKYAYYKGDSDKMVKAHTSIGNSLFKHTMSKMRSGFRIEVLNTEVLPESEAHEMAMVLLDNGPFIRQLMTIGYDTLEIKSGFFMYNWQMSKYQDPLMYHLK